MILATNEELSKVGFECGGDDVAEATGAEGIPANVWQERNVFQLSAKSSKMCG